MDTRRLALTASLSAALAMAGASVAVAHEGHDHGPPPPAFSVKDLTPRASAVGEAFQMVAIPKNGQLVIFLDDTATNIPTTAAKIDILAGDAMVTAEEIAPGLYTVSPWPVEGMSPEEASTTDITATVVAGDREEVLLAQSSGTGSSNGTGKGVEPAAAHADRIALWNGVRPFAVPVAAGVIALFGAVAGLRSTGRRRWFGLAVAGVSIVTMIAATSLV